MLVAGVIAGGVFIARGVAATDEPTAAEALVARAVRNLAIPRAAKAERDPYAATPERLQAAREFFVARCAVCHGSEGRGDAVVGRNLYPRAPDLRSAGTQALSDGALHFIIERGVQHTGMPAKGESRGGIGTNSWALVQYVRSLGPQSEQQRVQSLTVADSAHYVGSPACAKCHAAIFARWQKTPMANVVRDPVQHPEAIIPDLATNKVAPFTKAQVALVYGSIWKQRYFTQVGDELYPLGAQWDIGNRAWRPYNVPATADWWTKFYPPDNMHRPTGPTCDGCHSVDYNIRTHKVTEWNVGCERCHGPGSTHVANPIRSTILNPAQMNVVDANDSCIQCHSQGRPRTNPIEGRAYDWPVGYRVGLKLQDFWSLDDHTLGETSFTHFADGTAHKNRMQGNDYVQSQMYKHGVTCFSCHDVHGTEHYAQLRAPKEKLCLQCHAPQSANGPATSTIEAHTHHKAGSTGSACTACHMPRIATEGVPGAFVSSHTFRFITPAMTDKYKMPNACTTCHTDKSTAWATEAMRRWPEQSPWRSE
jgi:predicted CXXCH cytochrome family protein